jgi:hypothetical protein
MTHDQRTKPPATISLNDDQRNDISALRGLLFSEIRSLNSKATKHEVEIAKIKSELAQTIINSVKAEVTYLQAKVKSQSGFIPVIEGDTPKLK